MSAGHTSADRNPKVSPEEIKSAMSDPRVISALRVKPTINRSFDIPYLGSYSRDGRTIYIDRHLPGSIAIAGKSVNVIPFIVTHEHTEKTIIDVLGWKYQPSHIVATQVEHERVKNVCPVGPYEQALKPYIKADELEKVKVFPPDVDLTPYIDSKDTKVLMRIRALLNQAQWKKAIAGKVLPK